MGIEKYALFFFFWYINWGGVLFFCIIIIDCKYTSLYDIELLINDEMINMNSLYIRNKSKEWPI